MQRTVHSPPHPSLPAFSALAPPSVFVALAALVMLATLLAGSPAFAEEEPFVQGRCVSYDPVSRAVEVIKDLKADPADPEYGQFPPASFSLAALDEPGPKVGRRIKLDAATGRIVLYDPATRGPMTVPIHIVTKRLRVDRDDPLIFDQGAGRPKKLPKVDTVAGTVTMYSQRQDMLIVFAPPAEFLALPDETWESGDEVRITYGPSGDVRTYKNLSRASK